MCCLVCLLPFLQARRMEKGTVPPLDQRVAKNQCPQQDDGGSAVGKGRGGICLWRFGCRGGISVSECTKYMCVPGRSRWDVHVSAGLCIHKRHGVVWLLYPAAILIHRSAYMRKAATTRIASISGSRCHNSLAAAEKTPRGNTKPVAGVARG